MQARDSLVQEEWQCLGGSDCRFSSGKCRQTKWRPFVGRGRRSRGHVDGWDVEAVEPRRLVE
jgi:hypothetical protein